MTDIKIKKIEDFEIGFKRLKNAKLELAGEENIYEYLRARIFLSKLALNDVSPCSFYALRPNLEFQKILWEKLMEKFRIELFDLPGILYLEIDGRSVGLVPPFVEIYKEENGINTLTLQDGIHRFLLARDFGIKQKCIIIQNDFADKRYLPYAYPNSWKEVSIVDKVPAVKRRFRRKDPYSFMRPLKAIFDTKLVQDWADYGRS